MVGANGMAVLVIDDSDVDREAIMAVVEQAGFSVHGLPSPIGATKLARSIDAQLVIIDQHLPAMDGSKLAKLFRHSNLLRHIGLVLISGNDEASMQDAIRQSEADAFVSKAELHTALIPTLQRILERSRSRGTGHGSAR